MTTPPSASAATPPQGLTDDDLERIDHEARVNYSVFLTDAVRLVEEVRTTRAALAECREQSATAFAFLQSGVLHLAAVDLYAMLDYAVLGGAAPWEPGDWRQSASKTVCALSTQGEE